MTRINCTILSISLSRSCPPFGLVFLSIKKCLGLSRIDGSLLLPLMVIISLWLLPCFIRYHYFACFSFFSNLFKNTFLMAFYLFSSWLFIHLSYSLYSVGVLGVIPFTFPAIFQHFSWVESSRMFIQIFKGQN